MMLRGPGMTSRSFQITVCSRELRPIIRSSVNCSTIHITHIDQSFPYVTLITLQVISPSYQVCGLIINSLIIPIRLNRDSKRHREMIRWFEKPVGDTRRSNGESALYELLPSVSITHQSFHSGHRHSQWEIRRSTAQPLYLFLEVWFLFSHDSDSLWEATNHR